MSLPQLADRSLPSFEHFALPHMDSLFSLALHWTHNVADAEDLVQETYLRAYKYFDQFEIGTDFRSWIFRILRNSIINHHRKNQSRGIPVHLNLIEFELATPDADPVQGVAMRAALSRLSAEARMMVILAYLEGFTYQEIAQIMHCPIGTVMSGLFRARKRLRDALTEGDWFSSSTPDHRPGSLSAGRGATFQLG